MKTILITIPFGMSARNILRSGIFPHLCEKANVVLYSSLATDPAFRKEFGKNNVFFEPAGFHSSLAGKMVRKILDPIEALLFTERTGIETLLHYRDWLKAERPWQYHKIRLLALAFGWEPCLAFLRRLHLRQLWSRECAEILARRRVDLVFVTNIFTAADQQMALCAKEAGILVAGMPHSWDNPTSKSGVRQGSNPNPGRTVPVRFDKLIVWGEAMRREMIAYYGYAPEDIFAGGIPQFDLYAYRDRLMMRENFFKKIGADPARKLIVYAGGSPQYALHQEDYAQMLIQIIQSGRLPFPVQLLIRAHPHRKENEKMAAVQAKYRGVPGIFFVMPTSPNYMALPDVSWNSEKGDEYDLANMLAHADLVVTCSGSTILLDAAALDRPAINISFDGYQEETSPFRATRRSLDFTHVKKIVATRAFKIAYNLEELESQISRYLKDPSLEAEERKKLVALQGLPLDGQAGKRIADFLLDLLHAGGPRSIVADPWT